MKSILRVLPIVLATVSVGAHDLLPGRTQEQPVLLAGGDLYTVSDGVRPGTDLLFEAGRITRIGKGIDPPDGAEVIDVSGRRVYPGLIAPQTTLGLTEIGAVRATNDRAEVGEITPEAATHIAYNPDSDIIPTVRSHGIALAQVVPLGGRIAGRSMLIALDGWTKEDAAIRLVDGLHVYWPAASVGRRAGLEPEELEKRQKRLTEARRALRTAFEDARAYALARETDPETEIDLRWEAMRDVVGGELPVYITANDRRQIVEAVEFAKEMGVSMILVGGKEAYAVTDLLRAHDIPVVVGTTTSLPMRRDDDYDIAFRLPERLHRAGVRFCLSHVTWGGWDVRNLPFQAGQAAAFGLPREVALRAVTLSTAEIFGIDATYGSLEVGKSATLFVSDGDVMDTLGQQVRHLFIDGRRVDLDNRHKQLRRKYEQR